MNITIKNLKKSFILNNKEFLIFDNINLNIVKGDFISVTGFSGVGKSTFLHILGTIDLPSSGIILFNNNNIFSKDINKIASFRNKNIGFMFQFHYLLPEFSALENVMLPMLIARIEFSKAENIAKKLLCNVGLSSRFYNKPNELSGGEQQRVSLSRAICRNPQILLADEPIASLDEYNGHEVINIIKSLNKYHMLTVIMVTHNNLLANKAKKKLILTKNGFCL
jgi:lipoprotein-releasing system ATP-binding protein